MCTYIACKAHSMILSLWFALPRGTSPLGSWPKEGITFSGGYNWACFAPPLTLYLYFLLGAWPE